VLSERSRGGKEVIIILKVLAVCGMGLGSALLLRMTIEDVLKEAGIKAKVETADIATARGPAVDLIITSAQLAPQLGDVPAKVVIIHNFFDKDEMREKVLAALQVEG